MTDFIVTQPCATFGDDLDSVRTYVSEHNAAILLGNEFPVSTGIIGVYEMLGDPNHAFSDEICEVLTTRGVLNKTPWLDVNGKQMYCEWNGVKTPISQYEWGAVTFLELDEATLLEVGWDLRYTRGFYNLVAFNIPVTDAEPESDTTAEDSDDDSNANNSDDANYFNSSVLATE